MSMAIRSSSATGCGFLTNNLESRSSRSSSGARRNTVAIGTFLEKFEKLAEEDDPFHYSIRFLNP